MIMALIFGLGAASILLGAIVWSIRYPDQRIWPPQRSTSLHKAVGWSQAVVVFASAAAVGVLDWNSLGLPAVLRWSLGLLLLVLGNLIAWGGVVQIGMAVSSGDVDTLVTSGLYRYSRNPQYLADIAILSGWAVLSASFWVLPIAIAGIGVLAIAPFAEEPWLSKVYGAEYDRYLNQTPRDL